MGILSPAFVNRQAVSAPTASPRSHTCNGEFFRFASHEHKYDGSIGQPGPLNEASAGYLRLWSMCTYAICQGKHQVHSPPFLPHTHHPEFFPDEPHGSKRPLYATKRRSHPSIADTRAISAHTLTPYPQHCIRPFSSRGLKERWEAVFLSRKGMGRKDREERNSTHTHQMVGRYLPQLHLFC